MKRIVLASRNPGKLRELRELLVPVGFEAVSVADFPGVPDVDETGGTFEENAALKAVAIRDALGLPALADDSGLAVQALGGRPGVRSARYAGPHASDDDNNRRLLEELADLPDDRRSACYVCVVAWAAPGEEVRLFRGVTSGRITRTAIGSGGFGYDPYFLSDDLGVTFGVAPPAEKHAVSHRGRAMRLWLDWLGAADA